MAQRAALAAYLALESTPYSLTGVAPATVRQALATNPGVRAVFVGDPSYVGTVGAITALPGATNVIPGRVSFTLDIRAPADAHRKLAVAEIVRRIEAIAKRRELALQIDVTHENRTDYETAVKGFRWPDPVPFNWALDWFDAGLAAVPIEVPGNIRRE